MSENQSQGPSEQEETNTHARPHVESPHSSDKVGRIAQWLADHAGLAQDPSRILGFLLDEIRNVTAADVALLFGWDEKPKEWILISHHGMPKDFGKSGQIPRAWQSLPSIILQQGGTLVSNEISKDPRFVGQVIRGMNVQTFIGFSLRSEEKILGSLSLGFSKPDALHPGEEEVFATISKLVCPFLIQRAPEAEPEAKKEAPLEEPFVVGLDMAGRIVSINSRFAQYVGQTNEALRKTPLSKLLTPAGGAAYSDQLEALKSGQKNLPPFRLEVIKKGDLKGVLLAQLSLLQKDGKASGVELTAQDATEKGALEKEILKKNVELGILQSLFSSLSRSFKEEDVFKEVLQKAISLMDVEGGYLLHLDEKKQRLFLLAQKGLSAEKAQRLSKQGIKIGENIIGKMIEKLSPILAVAADVKAPLKKRWIGEEGLISYMGTPVKASGQAWGTLSLFSRTKFFTEDDLQVLSFIGKEIGFAIDNMNLFDDARRRVEDLTITNEVSQSITKSLHLEQLLSSVANSLTKMIGASNCYIFSIDDKRNLLCGAAASDHRGEAVRKMEIKMNENTLVPLTAREQRPFAIENAPEDPRVSKKWIEAFKSRSILSVPLIIKERVIGVVLLDETRYFRQFSAEEIKKVATLANQVAVAIENATLYQSVTKHMERLQTLSSAIVNIQEEERRRIARELHDEAGQALTAVKINLEWIEKEMGSPSAPIKERMEEIKSQVTKTLEELRRLSYDLRPAILDEMGLLPTLQWYIEEYSKRTKIAVHLQTNGIQKRFSPKIEILLYRITQEALTNVAKHAEAESVILALERKDVHAHLYITDDGKGFEVKKYFSSPHALRRGLGILGMKERVELAGGTFFIDSDPGQGTRISIKVPIVKRGSQ